MIFALLVKKASALFIFLTGFCKRQVIVSTIFFFFWKIKTDNLCGWINFRFNRISLQFWLKNWSKPGLINRYRYEVYIGLWKVTLLVQEVHKGRFVALTGDLKRRDNGPDLVHFFLGQLNLSRGQILLQISQLCRTGNHKKVFTLR